MTQPRPHDASLTDIFKYTAIITGIMAIFNAVFAQWILVVFFAIVSIVTAAMAFKKTRAERPVVSESDGTESHE